jgi:hypothetical protein
LSFPSTTDDLGRRFYYSAPGRDLATSSNKTPLSKGNVMFKRTTLLIFVGVSPLLLSFQNCSPVSFGVDDKVAALKQDVFDGGPNGPINDQNNNGVDDSYDLEWDEDTDDGGSPRDEETSDDTTPPNMTIPTVNHCSDNKSESLGSNVAHAKSLRLEVRDRAGKVVCTGGSSERIRSDLRNKRISLTNCALPAGDYKIAILNESGKDFAVEDASLLVKNGKVGRADTQVLMESNPKSGSSDDDETPPYMGTECDELASPLFIDLREEVDDSDILSSPDRGVEFDILGANGSPAYTKSKISWFEGRHFGLLALPDASGNVRNVDQLFGDNTKGPDGKFAANGFHALEKYDLNHDKRIDAKDDIYPKLRVWVDRDRDAKSRSRELTTLESRGITSIDLVYDENYRERDKYGNEIKYKSVVEFVDGTFKSIFDVWFKIH